MFRKTIRVPGSGSKELISLTAPEMLAQYRAADPRWESVLLKLREDSLNLDRKYARMVRIVGSIELAAIVGGICFLAVHGRF
jgi:hypothetical protein